MFRIKMCARVEDFYFSTQTVQKTKMRPTNCSPQANMMLFCISCTQQKQLILIMFVLMQNEIYSIVSNQRNKNNELKFNTV